MKTVCIGKIWEIIIIKKFILCYLNRKYVYIQNYHPESQKNCENNEIQTEYIAKYRVTNILASIHDIDN